MYTAIVEVANNRVSKYAQKATFEEAQAHCDQFGGFVFDGAYRDDLWVEGQAVTVHPEVETAEQAIARLDLGVEKHIQVVVAGRGYKSIERLIGAYSNSPNPKWKAEANAAEQWLTAIWNYCLQVKSDVENGLRGIPTEAELIAELPAFEDFLIEPA